MTKSPAKTAKKQSRQGFKPGKSGNPSGRPQGSRNKATIALEALLEGESEAITRKAIEMAKNGDMAAIRICLERIIPPRKSRPVLIDLPKVETAKDITKAQSVVIAAMANGDLTTDEATDISGILEVKRRSIETVEIEKRLESLEAQK
jgi:translation elongation factor EF-Tu-like GTPase